jgi:glycosyltransferase involved in cell wall biosynthesis
VNWLFVHQNFPGQYLHIVQRLAACGTERVVFLAQPNGNRIEGVRRINYQPIQTPCSTIYVDAAEFEAATIRAASVSRACRELARTGFRPDIVVGHNGWGELLNIKDVWPDVPMLGYFEFFYRTDGADVGFDPEFPSLDVDRARIRAKNAVNLLGLQVSDAGQSPTAWQRDAYPAWARPDLHIVTEGVDLSRCCPDPNAQYRLPTGALMQRGGSPLVTYVARNLEPYRGFHIFMRALPLLLQERPDLQIAIVGGDGVSYGRSSERFANWRDAMLAELGGTLDLDRVHFLGCVPYDDYLALLKVSSVHVYLSYPFVASWSLREALACGCAMVCGDTEPVREFVSDDENGLLVAFHDPKALACAVGELLENQELGQRLRTGARRRAELELDINLHHADFAAVVEGLLHPRPPRNTPLNERTNAAAETRHWRRDACLTPQTHA